MLSAMYLLFNNPAPQKICCAEAKQPSLATSQAGFGAFMITELTTSEKQLHPPTLKLEETTTRQSTGVWIAC